MPALSDAQRRWAFGVMGAAWARKHHMDNKGPLPAYVQHGHALLKKKRRRS